MAKEYKSGPQVAPAEDQSEIIQSQAEAGKSISEQEFSRVASETGRILALQPKKTVRLFQAPKGQPQLPDATVCINGYIYLLKRGVEVQVPESVYKILVDAGLI